MYRKSDKNQFTIYDFIHPFGGKLKSDNRWVLLHDSIDWDMIEEVYENNFDNKDVGNEAYPASVAFGALFIQRKKRLKDREVPAEIAENPYLQYFIGFKEYNPEMPFDASLLVYFRKRISDELMDEICEKMFLSDAKAAMEPAPKLECESDDKDDDGKNNPPGGNGGSSNIMNLQDEADTSHPNWIKVQMTHARMSGLINRGTLIIDATCTPADIAYPTDLELCDKARRWLEKIIDHYHHKYGSLNADGTKVRTYREEARLEFLKINKRRKKGAEKVREAIDAQLRYIKRDLGYIDRYHALFGDDDLYKVETERLATIKVFYEQQYTMLVTGMHSIADRIVNLAQPWVRPIVRGKSKAPTEFGAKISISVVGGYAFLDRLSFDAYNEGSEDEFQEAVEKYHKRFGFWPQRILADKIYRNKKNKAFCMAHGIRMSGPKVGRPGKDDAEEIIRELSEIGERNEVEGKFGTGKRKYGLGRIMAKLKETTDSMIKMDLFIMNTEHRIRAKLLCALKYIFKKCGIFIRCHMVESNIGSVNNDEIYDISYAV